MYENFGNFLLIIFTISKIDFTIKKTILGRKPGNRNFRKSQPVGLVTGSRQPLHVVTDFPFYGFLLIGQNCQRHCDTAVVASLTAVTLKNNGSDPAEGWKSSSSRSSAMARTDSGWQLEAPWSLLVPSPHRWQIVEPKSALKKLDWQGSQAKELANRPGSHGSQCSRSSDTT